MWKVANMWQSVVCAHKASELAGNSARSVELICEYFFERNALRLKTIQGLAIARVLFRSVPRRPAWLSQRSLNSQLPY
jgi:hypothetical protein